MSDNSPIPKEKHLQNALYGTPKVNPDEQRHYLGTFRERVSLTISVGQLNASDWTDPFKKELTASNVEIIFFNGNIDQSVLKPYIIAATKAGVNFTIKTTPEYHTNPDNLAIVVAAKKAIYVEPVDVEKKYGQAATTPQPRQDQPKKSLWAKLFHRH